MLVTWRLVILQYCDSKQTISTVNLSFLSQFKGSQTTNVLRASYLITALLGHREYRKDGRGKMERGIHLRKITHLQSQRKQYMKSTVNKNRYKLDNGYINQFW